MSALLAMAKKLSAPMRPVRQTGRSRDQISCDRFARAMTGDIDIFE